MAFSLKVIPNEWGDLRGSNGERFSEELQATLEALPQVQMRPLGSPIAGYLELHIEQGPSLERENIPIGIVYGIQGTRWLEVTITGQASHAGTTAHSFRRDPMTAAVAALKTLFDTVMPQDEEARFTIGRFRRRAGIRERHSGLCHFHSGSTTSRNRKPQSIGGLIVKHALRPRPQLGVRHRAAASSTCLRPHSRTSCSPVLTERLRDRRLPQSACSRGSS